MKTEAATIYGGGSSQEYDHCDRCKGDYPVGQSKVVKAWRDTGGWTFVDSIVHLCDRCCLRNHQHHYQAD